MSHIRPSQRRRRAGETGRRSGSGPLTVTTTNSGAGNNRITAFRITRNTFTIISTASAIRVIIGVTSQHGKGVYLVFLVFLVYLVYLHVLCERLETK